MVSNSYVLGLLTLLAIYGILLIGLDVTVGYLGQVNLAHAAFLGLGAYAAGLILEPAHIQILEERELCRLEQLVQPLVVVLSPLFFVLMGARIDPAALLAPRILLFTLVLGALGIAGKLVAGLAAGREFRRELVGWGMVPRGEVGLIFVAAGSQLELAGRPLLSGPVQAGIIGALLLTTLAGPLGLGWALRRR